MASTKYKLDPDSDSVSATKKESQPVQPQFPEGGVRAWMVVVGCWCISFVSFGIVNAFGVYETYYLDTYLSDYSPSTVAWIGSIQAFAQFSATIISGPLTDRYGPMVVIWPVSILLVVAMMLTSLCTEFYQFIVCQGILLGACSGLIFGPAFSVIGHYFFKKRGMAMAYASTGSPIGGTIYPIIMTALIKTPNVGFAWAQRVCAFLSLFLLLIAAVTIHATPLRRKGNLFLFEAFKSPAYSLQVVGLFLVVFGFWTPYFYIATYAKAHGMPAVLASYLFAILNAGSFFGRMVVGTFAQRLGQFNIVTFSCFGCAILLFSWLKIDTPAGLIVLVALFGASSGVIIAMMMSTLAHCAPHPSQIGAYLGQATAVIGLAALAGPPITGALIDVKNNNYSQGIIFSASFMMAGALVFTFARYVFAKDKLIA
ncbi:major facilitator superfamily domain-containing protein [Lasiosphaeris hirsuta]|uniref:Major facilitator superfamily domain-containing protein n=1 Tax=Lasiosphaeris hirsuta TaxID=260670 RepID=A0AA40A3A1_9PEZI|nr:major facilitator superfamily domain-containing protein [Lasiosphaeris hirsuta]